MALSLPIEDRTFSRGRVVEDAPDVTERQIHFLPCSSPNEGLSASEPAGHSRSLEGPRSLLQVAGGAEILVQVQSPHRDRRRDGELIKTLG